MRIKLAILLLVFQPITMKSQTAIATLGNLTSCNGEMVLVPLDVIEFNDVAAMTIYIGYDTNVATFISLANINPQIPASLSYYASNGQVSIAYSSPDPFYISGETLFDLRFNFLNDTTALTFNPGTEIANSVLEIIPLETNPGSIATSIQIIDQPDSVQSYPDNDVTFKVTSLGNTTYQWQENSGSGWNDLQNNSIYSGVSTDSLTIYDVPLSFNGYLYQCILTKEECTVITDVALLEVATAFPVATIGQKNSCPDNSVNDPVLIGDFFDVIEFSFNIAFDTISLYFQGLENIHPDLAPGDLTVTQLNGTPGITIHWESATPVSIASGILFDMKFWYYDGNNQLTFEDGTVVLNSSSNPVNITLNDGSIDQYSLPSILAQPENDTVLKNATATFSILASETQEYQWLESSDGGMTWDELNDGLPYFNTHSSVLTIAPASLDLNENKYICRLTGTYCTVLSDEATLFVDTLTFIGSPEINLLSNLYPNPFNNIITLTLSPENINYTLLLYTSYGTLCMKENIRLTNGRSAIDLDLSSLKEGAYFLQLIGNKGATIINENYKILKTR